MQAFDLDKYVFTSKYSDTFSIMFLLSFSLHQKIADIIFAINSYESYIFSYVNHFEYFLNHFSKALVKEENAAQW